MVDPQAVIRAFAAQAMYCDAHGSPFTARLMRGVGEGLAQDDPWLQPLRDWPGDPRADVLPLRVAGALHALVLAGRAPALAAVYPGGAEAGDEAALWPRARAAWASHPEWFAAFLARPPQTNETGRAAALLGGFLTAASWLPEPRPLRLLELGASAGLNLHWDRFRYAFEPGWHWPDAWTETTAAPRLAPQWEGVFPPRLPLQVISRAGCDREPIDIRDPDERLRLRAYVWADQSERLQRLDTALAVAAAFPVYVERADADEWIERQLAEPASGTLTVVYHSIFWNYLDAAAQRRIADAIRAAGARATDEAPLAWLRFELDDTQAQAHLVWSQWPGPQDELLAEADAHARRIRWHGPMHAAAQHRLKAHHPTMFDSGDSA